MATTAAAPEKPCWMLISEGRSEPPSMNEIKTALESGTTEKKIEYMKKTISLLLQGEPMPQLLMAVIRYVQPNKDHTLKKLCAMYFEIVEKRGQEGKPIDTLILACNAWMQDLNHPNEYVRGNMLRFLCKVKEPDLLEPLVPSIRTCLEHRNPYVRRNAVLTVFAVFRSFNFLIPDAPEIIFGFLDGENDVGCKRNGFLMLCYCSQDLAVEYLIKVVDQVNTFDDVLQLAVVELIRKVYRSNPQEQGRYIAGIIQCLGSNSPAVKYEAANTLTVISASGTAVKAAATTYIDLIVNQSDNNVKLIVLDRLVALKENYSKVLQDLLMDLLRALASPNMDIREKTLAVAMDLVSPRNIDEVILVLKKEVQKTDVDQEKASEYRRILIRTIHTCAVRFPDVAGSVVHMLLDFVCDKDANLASDVVVFVREVVYKYDKLRSTTIAKLLEIFPNIKSGRVFRGVLWIIAEYASSRDELKSSLEVIEQCLGDVPFVFNEEGEEGEEGEAKKEASAAKAAVAQKLNADGTYATQTAASETRGQAGDAVKESGSAYPLRDLLFQGDFFLASSLSSALAKIMYKCYPRMKSENLRNFTAARVMLILTSLLRLGKSGVTPNAIDKDSEMRIGQCLRMIAQPSEFSRKLLLEESGDTFASMLAEEAARVALTSSNEPTKVKVQADDVITVRQLRGQADQSMPFADEDEAALNAATGMEIEEGNDLKRVHQLTGFSDPIYAEASVRVHQYDISLKIFLLNQSEDTLQNLTVELSTYGDLKLVERPISYTLGPGATKTIHASIKVSSTEAGIIFGSVVYDVAGSAANNNCVVLSDIHIDIMDYILPAHCNDQEFRSMWQEFEWENKVVVDTTFSDIVSFLKHIVSVTNMKCLTPEAALEGECGFLAANLYARSIFGEDALANVSVQTRGDKISGHIRIRSKTQGIALSLGDKITLGQKEPLQKTKHEDED